MNRRSVLAGVGAASPLVLGGCLASRIGGDGDPESDQSHYSTRIVDVHADPQPELQVVPTVSVETAEATAASPAGVTVGWENVSDETVRLGERRSAVFHDVRSDDERLHLLSDEFGTWEETVSFDGCWSVSKRVGGPAVYGVANLDPGERYVAESKLYRTDTDCSLDGLFHFQTTVTVQGPHESELEGTTVEWGFDLEIETT